MAGKGKPLKGVGTAGPYSGDIKIGGKSGSKKKQRNCKVDMMSTLYRL